MFQCAYEFPLLPLEVRKALSALVEANKDLSYRCRDLNLSLVVTELDRVICLTSDFIEVLDSFRELQKESDDAPLFVIYTDFDDAIDLYRELAIRNMVMSRRLESALS